MTDIFTNESSIRIQNSTEKKQIRGEIEKGCCKLSQDYYFSIYLLFHLKKYIYLHVLE